MAKQKDIKITSLADEAKLERLLLDACRATGKLFARTEREVASEEQRQENMQLDLPEALRDSESTWRRMQEPRAVALSTLPVDAETCDNLARAARQGKAIPQDVEDQMHRDREKAEQERKR